MGNQGPDISAIERAAQISRWYFKLKSGHAVMDTYLQRLGKRGTDRYWECTSQTWIDTFHILLDCSEWREETRKIHERCNNYSRGEPRAMRQLMESRKVTPAVLGLIAATRAGLRAQRYEQEEEIQGKRRDEAQA